MHRLPDPVCRRTNDSRACLRGDGVHWDRLRQPVRIWLAQSRAEQGEVGKGLCSADTATEVVDEIGDESFIKLWRGLRGEVRCSCCGKGPCAAV